MYGTQLTSLALSFNPVSPNGLLFYYGDNTQIRDFLSIAMIGQRVEYRFDLGSGPAILISNPVTLNEWHYVVVYLDGPSGSMIIDDGSEITSNFEGALSVLNAAGDMFVGGVSDYNTVSRHAGTEVGHSGCISDVEVDANATPHSVTVCIDHILLTVNACLQINGITVDLLGDAVGGRGIAECSLTSCADVMCENGGYCQVTDTDGLTCVCTPGFTGPTCNIG